MHIAHLTAVRRLSYVITAGILFAASAKASAQSTAPAAKPPAGPDLQGYWDFTMHVSATRKSTGVIALGPVDGAWAGSITPDSTNTLAIRSLVVKGDSVRMIVASREGDVPFRGRLSADGHVMEGIVDYHGGSRYPMTATHRRRARRN